jgi:hypothetical protein
METVIGCRLAAVTRPAWHWPGDPVEVISYASGCR